MHLQGFRLYDKVSKDLFDVYSFVLNPDLATGNETIAWATAFWYWDTYVHVAAQTGKFGSLVRRIMDNGQCEDVEQKEYLKKEMLTVYQCF